VNRSSERIFGGRTALDREDFSGRADEQTGNANFIQEERAMLMNSIASSYSSMTVLNPVAPAPVRAAATSAATALAAPATADPSAPATTTTSTATAARSGRGHASEGASASSGAAEEMQETSFSTTVAGTQYSGSVAESGGEYVASVASLSGATASGSSLISAENSLTIRIDELV
jgi:hypothetical protein